MKSWKVKRKRAKHLLNDMRSGEGLMSLGGGKFLRFRCDSVLTAGASLLGTHMEMKVALLEEEVRA